jgi:hypothetical protein
LADRARGANGREHRSPFTWGRDLWLGAECCCAERAEAEAILDGDRGTAVGSLLRLDELVEANQRLVEAKERLEARVGELERL